MKTTKEIINLKNLFIVKTDAYKANCPYHFFETKEEAEKYYNGEERPVLLFWEFKGNKSMIDFLEEIRCFKKEYEEKLAWINTQRYCIGRFPIRFPSLIKEDRLKKGEKIEDIKKKNKEIEIKAEIFLKEEFEKLNHFYDGKIDPEYRYEYLHMAKWFFRHHYEG